MVEVEAIGMQAEAVYGILCAAIFVVSAHRMAEVGHVDAYLILAPGFQS
jgi:hypothetical protein